MHAHCRPFALLSLFMLPFTEPMECLPVQKLAEGDGWIYELKLDGYRAQGIYDSGEVRLLSKNGKDLSKKFPLVTSALHDALYEGTVIDGELVATDVEGRPSFNALQNATPHTPVAFYAFDILTHRGQDLKNLPLRDRLSILDSSVVPSSHALLCDHFPGPADNFVAAVKRLGGEGVVAKRLDSRYEPGKRSGAWQKMRLNLGQEFVIGGFTPGGHGFDAVIIGVYQGRQLHYVARVRAGFVPASRLAVYAQLKPLISVLCPFVNLPEPSAGRWGQGLTAGKMKECIWVKPQLVGRFDFLEWTGANHVRHIKFVAMRSDKDPRKVVRESE
jgi:DNA ligase D-like protein (predicted ligase)